MITVTAPSTKVTFGDPSMTRSNERLVVMLTACNRRTCTTVSFVIVIIIIYLSIIIVIFSLSRGARPIIRSKNKKKALMSLTPRFSSVMSV